MLAKRMQVRNPLAEFASQTSMHGIPKVIQARSLLPRLFWSLVCMAAGAMFCTQLLEIIRRYFSYPKKVTVEVVTTPVAFPSVSLCNMRNLDFYVLNLINEKFLIDSKPISHINDPDNEFVRQYMLYMARFEPLYNRSGDDYAKEFQEVFSRTSLSSNIPEHVLSPAAIQLDELVVNCFFGGRACNRSSEFQRFFDPYYFNCFTYNSPYKISSSDSSDPQLLSEGIENGWSTVLLPGSGMLETNVNLTILPGLHESHSPVSGSDGVRVVVHPPGSKPFPLTEGYDIPPGFSVSLGLRPRRNVRIGAPYGNCTETSPLPASRAPGEGKGEGAEGGGGEENGSAYRGSSGYRTIFCTKMCLQRHVIESCDCYDETLPKLDGHDGVKPCRSIDLLPDSCMYYPAPEACLSALLTINARIQCTRQTRGRITRNTRLMSLCLCHPPCDEVYYDVSYSLSKWPALGYEGDAAYIDIFYITNYTARFVDEPLKYSKMKEYFQDSAREETLKNFARLNVYVADSNVLITQESPDYEHNQLVSDIGGQLGLWVGISIITIAEVLELICQLFSRVGAPISVSGQRSREDGEEEGKEGEDGVGGEGEGNRFSLYSKCRCERGGRDGRKRRRKRSDLDSNDLKRYSNDHFSKGSEKYANGRAFGENHPTAWRRGRHPQPFNGGAIRNKHSSSSTGSDTERAWWGTNHNSSFYDVINHKNKNPAPSGSENSVRERPIIISGFSFTNERGMLKNGSGSRAGRRGGIDGGVRQGGGYLSYSNGTSDPVHSVDLTVAANSYGQATTRSTGAGGAVGVGGEVTEGRGRGLQHRLSRYYTGVWSYNVPQL